MKTCTYCGKEYNDDASVCVIDGQPLTRVTQQAKPQDDKSTPTERGIPTRPPSYAVAWGFIIAAALVKLIGGWLSESVADSAQHMPFFQSGVALNQAAGIQVFCNWLLVGLGVVGVILLVRAFRVSSTVTKQATDVTQRPATTFADLAIQQLSQHTEQTQKPAQAPERDNSKVQ